MKRVACGLAMLAAPWTAPWLAAIGQDRPPARATEIVMVVQPDLSPVTSLTLADFTVRSDGEPATVHAVARIREPLSLVILIDASASMGVTFQPGAVAGAIGASVIDDLQRGDRVRVGSIAGRPQFSAGFIDDSAKLRTLVAEAASGKGASRTGPSPVWDAVWQAAEDLRAEPGRHVILLISDGRATGNLHGHVETLRYVAASAVTVLAIGESGRTTLPQLNGSAVMFQPFLAIQDLADQTGGLYAVDRNVASSSFARGPGTTFTRPQADQAPLSANVKPLRLPVKEILARMMRAQRQGYTVTFTSPGDGKFHWLDVTVRRPDAVAHARSAYLAR